MKRYTGVLIAIVVFVIQSVLSLRVGVSWDEPASFFVGQANLKFWETGNRAYLNSLKNKELFAQSPIQYIYGEDIYPPFPFTVGAMFSHFLSDTFHWVNTFDGYHIGEVFLGSVGVWAMYGLATVSGLSPAAAVVTTLLYALYPSIWGPMRNDAKDIPLVSMMVVSAYFFLLWISTFKKQPAWKNPFYGFAFAVSLGLAGATKPTAAIFVFIAIVWGIVSGVLSSSFRSRFAPFRTSLWIVFVLMGISLGAFLFAWPWLWEQPVEKLVRVFTFFKTVGYNMPTPFFGTIYHAAINLPKIYALTILVIQTPLPILGCFLVGFPWAIWQFIGKKRVIPGFFVVWFILGMGRFFLPGVIIYSWVRHFIDVMPAFFVLSGFGFARIVNGCMILFRKIMGEAWIEAQGVRRVQRLVMLLIGGGMLIHLVYISISFFPYEMSYFNMLVGGTKKVAAEWYFDVGQGAGVREAMEFIAKDSKGKDVNVYPCLMGHLARFYAPSHVHVVSAPELGNYTIMPNSPSWFEGALTFAKFNHERVYTVQRSGADLFYVYKYVKQFGWRCGWETESNYVW